MSPGELAAARFKILRDNTYDSIEYYADMKDLIFVLRNTPIIPGFDIDKDHRFLEEIDDKYKTQFGIKTNSARYLIIAKKD